MVCLVVAAVGKIVSPAKHMTFECAAYVHAVIASVNMQIVG